MLELDRGKREPSKDGERMKEVYQERHKYLRVLQLGQGNEGKNWKWVH